MAIENKSPSVAPKGPSLSDVQCKDNLIAVALREIVRSQLAEKKWNAEFAGTWAVRYANATMAARSTETAPLKVVMSKGTPAKDKDPVVGITGVESLAADSVGKLVPGDSATKTIDELIGAMPEVQEVK